MSPIEKAIHELNIRQEDNFISDLEYFKEYLETLLPLEQIYNDDYIDRNNTIEVFAIKDCAQSRTGKQAFIGYRTSNGNFYFKGVEYTGPPDLNN